VALATPVASHARIPISSCRCRAVFRAEIRPAGDAERGLRAVCAVARDGERINQRPLLLSFVVAAADTYLAGPPLPIVRAVLAVLRVVGRLRGADRTFARHADT
jgi:hypothetical protein